MTSSFFAASSLLLPLSFPVLLPPYLPPLLPCLPPLSRLSSTTPVSPFPLSLPLHYCSAATPLVVVVTKINSSDRGDVRADKHTRVDAGRRCRLNVRLASCRLQIRILTVAVPGTTGRAAEERRGERQRRGGGERREIFQPWYNTQRQLLLRGRGGNSDTARWRVGRTRGVCAQYYGGTHPGVAALGAVGTRVTHHRTGAYPTTRSLVQHGRRQAAAAAAATVGSNPFCGSSTHDAQPLGAGATFLAVLRAASSLRLPPLPRVVTAVTHPHPHPTHPTPNLSGGNGARRGRSACK